MVDQMIQKRSYSTFHICDGEYISFKWAHFTYNSIFFVFHPEHRHIELKSRAAEKTISASLLDDNHEKDVASCFESLFDIS